MPNKNGEMDHQNGDDNTHLKDAKCTENWADFTELAQLLRENSVDHKTMEEIIGLANIKAQQWNKVIEKYEKDKLLEQQLHDLKLKAANQNSDKAIELFNLLAENGIDIDAILTDRSADSIRRYFQSRTFPSPNEAEKQSLNSTIIHNSNSTTDNECKLMRENHVLNGEVNSLEENYSNLFKLYEKTRLNCVNLKEVEQSLNAKVEQLERKYFALHKMYMELLVEAQRKLEDANNELKKQETAHEHKTLSIRMALKKAQIRTGVLETELEMKNRENAELHSICDQLIAARQEGGHNGTNYVIKEA